MGTDDPPAPPLIGACRDLGRLDWSFADIAASLEDICRWERHRIEHTHWLAIRGHCEPPPDVAFAGWRERLVRMQAGQTILTILVPYEPLVRGFDPRLTPS
jgi:hypothetical protein